MEAFAVFLVVFVAAVSADSCYNKIDSVCSQPSSKPQTEPTLSASDLESCNAIYGDIDIMQKHLSNFANSHIKRSFEYLLMSTHYANYQKNRAGFEKLFRDLSDSKWEHSIELIKHITKRGGKMEFRRPRLVEGLDKNATVHKSVYELYEIQSIAKALGIEKQLAAEAFEVHREASGRNEEKHDPEISSYIEEEFVHDHAKTIRKLAGYVTDLKSMLSGKDASLSLFLFDEYLQKE